MEHKLANPEEVKCGDITVDVALEESIAGFKSAIGEIGATICEVAKRTNSRIDQVEGDMRTYSDKADEAILNVVDALGKRVEEVAKEAAVKGGADIAGILAAAKAEAEAIVAAALEINPQAKQELEILLTLVQEAPELRNIAGIISRLSDVEKRVTELENNKFTVEDVDCRSIAVVVRLADRITDAMKGFRTEVMNCAYPVTTATAA
jgi:hypothetical protein